MPLTEQPNPASQGIDVKSSREIVGIMHDEDVRAVQAVAAALDEIARVVDQVVESLQAGGRIVYVGAGTSGRIAVLDASECPPTFGVPPDRVCAVIAGGDRALRAAVEGAEDSADDGRASMADLNVRPQDVVCGIAASGTTPFVWGALEEAEKRDASTVLVTSNPGWSESRRADLLDYVIVVPVGPEVIAGSTRMKAGTATKLVLNMISTAAMIRWGKVYDNLMVDVVPTNQKLYRRAVSLVSMLGGVDPGEASRLLDRSGGEVKTAILVARSGLEPAGARALLAAQAGVLRRALAEAAGESKRSGNPPA